MVAMLALAARGTSNVDRTNGGRGAYRGAAAFRGRRGAGYGYGGGFGGYGAAGGYGGRGRGFGYGAAAGRGNDRVVRGRFGNRNAAAGRGLFAAVVAQHAAGVHAADV